MDVNTGLNQENTQLLPSFHQERGSPILPPTIFEIQVVNTQPQESLVQFNTGSNIENVKESGLQHFRQRRDSQLENSEKLLQSYCFCKNEQEKKTVPQPILSEKVIEENTKVREIVHLISISISQQNCY